MKILILGASGMLGHRAWMIFRKQVDTYVTLRQKFQEYEPYGLFDKQRTIDNIDALDFSTIEKAIEEIKPNVVLNCIGIIKQLSDSKNYLKSIEINALLPHKLAKICEKSGIRLIHVSTDCVFSGEKGNYLESDPPDARDLYGKTKFLGEVSYGSALTIRTSIIGPELASKHGLLEWFLSQKEGRIKGYRQAFFNGFTTRALCDIILDIITRHKSLKGLYHISSEPIDKFSLLSMVTEIYGLNVEIEPDEEFVCDRRLNSKRFRESTGFKPDSWRKMITQIYKDQK